MPVFSKPTATGKFDPCDFDVSQLKNHIIDLKAPVPPPDTSGDVCPWYIKWLTAVPVIGPIIGIICAALPISSSCYTAWKEGGEAWENKKVACSGFITIIEVGALVAAVVIMYFGSTYITSAATVLTGLRDMVNAILGKLWSGGKAVFDVFWDVLKGMLSFVDPIAERTDTSPLLWKANIVTLFAWCALTAAADAEGVLDDFFADTSFGKKVHKVFEFFNWPERKAIELAKSVGGELLGIVAECLTAPFSAAALLFSLPVAALIAPIMILAEATEDEYHKLKGDGGVDGIDNPTAASHNDVLPGDVPTKRVCAPCP